jgi:hypothetical protein
MKNERGSSSILLEKAEKFRFSIAFVTVIVYEFGDVVYVIDE